ncbi:hypothetical protein BROUX41_001894 [Berkeleyomyces rouxiae]|uniref:uncharacterized protein n=1 Tax=Berkeleyomyces rouxiae TaxID=2035830 RepID=UPI003B7E6283
MAAPGLVSAFFEKRRREGHYVFEGPVPFELHSYIANYRGIPPPRIFLRTMDNTRTVADLVLLEEAVKTLAEVAPDDPDAKEDAAWIDKIEAVFKEENEQLQADFHKSQHMSDEKKMCVSQLYLGSLCSVYGKPASAMEHFSTSWELATTDEEYLDVQEAMMIHSFHMRDWSLVATNAKKTLSIRKTVDDLDLSSKSAAFTCLGIAYMYQNELEKAYDEFERVELAPRDSLMGDVSSASDVAMYGSLLSLALMSRTEIQERVLSNVAFRVVLGMAPNLLRAVVAYVTGRYGLCLTMLESHRSHCLLDIHMSKHAEFLYGKIRAKCIEQFCMPFSKVTIKSLERVFGQPDKDIVDELKLMIESGMKARIDTIEGVLIPPFGYVVLDHIHKMTMDMEQRQNSLQNGLRQMGLDIANLDDAAIVPPVADEQDSQSAANGAATVESAPLPQPQPQPSTSADGTSQDTESKDSDVNMSE